MNPRGLPLLLGVEGFKLKSGAFFYALEGALAVRQVPISPEVVRRSPFHVVWKVPVQSRVCKNEGRDEKSKTNDSLNEVQPRNQNLE